MRPVVFCWREFCAYLAPREEASPAVLIFLAVCPEVPSKLLDLPLSLAIHLRMETVRQAHHDSKQAEESFAHMGDELWTAIRDNILWYSEVPEDMVE